MPTLCWHCWDCTGDSNRNETCSMKFIVEYGIQILEKCKCKSHVTINPGGELKNRWTLEVIPRGR